MTRASSIGVVFALLFLIVMVFGMRGCAEDARQPNNPADETVQAVRGVLNAQVAAWNRGDVDGFMDGYEQSDGIIFISGDDVTRGWQTVLDRYKKNYDTREKMGTLVFAELEIKPLSPFYTQAIGRWQLTRADASTPHGRFTLLFRRTINGWRIVHDHTSTAQ